MISNIMAFMAVLAFSDDSEHKLILQQSASPLSWSVVADETSKPSFTEQVMPVANSTEPVRATSVRLVDFKDANPYGDLEQRRVWLTTFEELPVTRSDGTPASVTLNLAMDATSGFLVCAFTAPKAVWVSSTEESYDIDKSYFWDMSPARHESMQSTIQDVWMKLQSELRAIDRPGQVIIRPRYSNNKTYEGEDAHGNVWVVELLGSHMLSRNGRSFTKRASLYKDGDLEEVLGGYAP